MTLNINELINDLASVPETVRGFILTAIPYGFVIKDSRQSCKTNSFYLTMINEEKKEELYFRFSNHLCPNHRMADYHRPNLNINHRYNFKNAYDGIGDSFVWFRP